MQSIWLGCPASGMQSFPLPLPAFKELLQLLVILYEHAHIPWPQELSESVQEGILAFVDGRGQPSERQMSRAESRASRADSAGAPSEATEPAATTRAGSPKRKLSIRPFRRHHAAVAPKDGSPSDASEAFHDPLELQSRSASYASETFSPFPL